LLRSRSCVTSLLWLQRADTLPQIHIVTFDANGKIQQIRQNWDQGSLLKLIDVIGKTGRNWPIHDGVDQIKLIASSVKSAGKTPVDSAARKDEQETSRSRGNSTNVTRDPHASLSLFAPRDKNLNDTLPAVVAPRASAKPPPRDYHDLFVGNDSDNSPASQAKTPVAKRAESPSKESVIAPKGGAGKNYAPSRLFDTEDAEVESPLKNHSAEHFYRPNPTKYQHFDFGDNTEEPQVKHTPLKQVKSSKHGSQWNFDDFNTPAKVVPGKVLRTNEVRHWGNSDDEVVDSPIKAKKVHHPRKDADAHFEFKDDGEFERPLIGRPRGAGHNTGLGLYQNNLYDDETGAPTTEEPKHVDTISNVKDRSKDFDPHFKFTDVDSPGQKPAPAKISDDRAKAVKMMEANWSATDASPSQKENVPASPTTSRPTTGTGKGPLTEATNTMSKRNDNPKGITIGGDGMGGKKGSGRQWGFGDDSDGEEANNAGKNKFVSGRQQGKAQATGGDFWDF